MEKIGEIRFIRRYPVKSMMGEDLKEAMIESSGLVGDRVYAFIDDRNDDKKFPWMTARQAHEFLLYKPRFVSHASEISESEVVVTCPDGKEYSVTDGNFENHLEKKHGYEMSLKHDKNGCFDARPISLFSLQTAKKLEEETKLEHLSHLRFRANLYASWDNGEPFYEDKLLDKSLQIGEILQIRIVKKDSRCIIPTLDPRTSISSPVVLETIKKSHGGYAGVYAEVERPGLAKVGDEIRLLE